MCSSGGGAVREFSAAGLSLHMGSSRWGSEWFGTHKTAINQVRSPTEASASAKPLGRGRATLKKHKLRGRKVTGQCSKPSPFPCILSRHCYDHLLTRIFSCCPFQWEPSTSLLWCPVWGWGMQWGPGRPPFPV